MTSSTIDITRSASPLPDDQREAILDNPGFGKYFTDHMVQIKWTQRCRPGLMKNHSVTVLFFHKAIGGQQDVFGLALVPLVAGH